MSTIKRGRGRPPGTGLNDDPTLSKVADLLLANPRMKPTTAMARVLDRPGPSTVRRLQVKWHAKGVTYLAEAQARRAAQQEADRRSLESTIRRQSVEAYRSSRGLGAALGAFDSPAMRALRDLQDSPSMRALRDIQDGPLARLMRETIEGPLARMLREDKARARLFSDHLKLPKF